MDAIHISGHAHRQMELRGATQVEVETAIREGEASPGKGGRLVVRKNFSFQSKWKGRYYETKQVAPVVVHDADGIVVVTVYVFYFGGTA